jgi:hypothetical protein
VPPSTLHHVFGVSIRYPAAGTWSFPNNDLRHHLLIMLSGDGIPVVCVGRAPESSPGAYVRVVLFCTFLPCPVKIDQPKLRLAVLRNHEVDVANVTMHVTLSCSAFNPFQRARWRRLDTCCLLYDADLHSISQNPIQRVSRSVASSTRVISRRRWGCYHLRAGNIFRWCIRWGFRLK